MSNLLRRQPVWVLLAIASGGCAAFNGVFAKLTTTSLTTSLSATLTHLFTSTPSARTAAVVEFGVRAFFFGMNLLFNLAMWTLFTAALTRASSTTRVSIVNVSANFMVTAMLGWAVFGERLNGWWWVGAGLLGAGNVVIGRREEGEKPGGTVGLDESVGEAREAEGLLGREGGDGTGTGTGNGEELEDLVELDESPRLSGDEIRIEEERLKKGEDADAPL